MRFLRAVTGLLVALSLAGLTRAGRAAEPPPGAETVTDPWTTDARKHFKNGVRLYQAAKYAEALAEFQAAYQKKPGPGSLQNVALCQKALLRYAEAADTLKLLLERHANELSEEEEAAASTARDELEAHVGTIVIRVSPSHAKTMLDGRLLDSASLGVRLRTNVGEHTVVADAPGFGRATKSVRVAAGANDVPVDLALTPVMGFLDVRASDPAAVVAIDGRPVGLGTWAGPVSPGEDHLIQVYRTGFEAFETRVTVAVGETKAVSGTLGARIEGAAGGPPPDTGALPPPPTAKPVLGWYSIAGLNLLGTGAAPLDFDVSGEGTNGGAFSLNLRVGRRLWTTLGAEVLLDAGSLTVERACDKGHEELTDGPHDCDTPGEIQRNYQLGWFRLGPLVRLSTPGQKWRFGAGFGAGLVWHQLKVARHEGQDFDGGRAAGWDPFFLLEVGFAYHFGHLSIGLDLAAQIDGAGSLEGTFDGARRKAFDQSGGTLPMLGFGLRAGYSQWAADKKGP
jgi:hypothetical protein